MLRQNTPPASAAQGETFEREDVPSAAPVRCALSAAVNALREATNDNAKLLAIRDGAKALTLLDDDTGAIDRLSEVAINMHDMAPDAVRAMLDAGVQLGENAKRSAKKGWNGNGDDPDFDVLPDEPSPKAKASPITIKATTWTWREPEEIERRKWLCSTHYVRGSVTSTIGKRGGGKTNRAIVEAISMATGRDLLETGNMPDRPQRVWYIGEDTRDEIERRIVAACAHYGIKADEIGDRLAFDSVYDFPPGALKLAIMNGGKVVPNRDAIAVITANLKARAIDVLILDPLKKFHGVKENDQEMDEVMTILFEIAKDANASVEFLHHTRKQSAGNAGTQITADDARGADAITAGPRDVRIVNPMSSKEAADFGIPTTEAWRYSRIDDGKQNLKPPGKAAWAQSASYLLPCGDSVGVLQPWTPPQAFDGITKADAEVAQRLAQGGAYRANSQAEDWFGYALGEALGLDPRNNPADKSRLRGMIKTWVKNKVLREEKGVSGNRHKTIFIVPGPTNMRECEVADDVQLLH